MDFHAEIEIDLPQADVWSVVSDFETVEALVADRGGRLDRLEGHHHGAATADGHTPGLGTAWNGMFPVKGREIEFRAEVVRFEAPERLDLEIEGNGLTGESELALADGAEGGTLMRIRVKIEGHSLRAKVFLQPLRLAHGALQTRFAERMGNIARSIEAMAAAKAEQPTDP
ncbi:MAG: SRPBCC family protein [Pseudomonadota bacterium]